MSIAREEIEKMVKTWLETVEQITKSEGLPVIPDEKTGDPLWVDVRELRLKYLIPIKRVKKFFDGLKEGKVYATRCAVKGEYFSPHRLTARIAWTRTLSGWRSRGMENS
jgi:uncharacterized protein